MSKKVMEKLKQNIAEIVKCGEWHFLWDWRFDLPKVAQKLEYRGLKGEDFWKDELLEMVLAPFRVHTKRQDYDEAKVDSDLQLLAQKIGLHIDRIRKQFYAFELESPAKEEPKAPETKKEPIEKPEVKKEPEKEEIVIKGEEE